MAAGKIRVGAVNYLNTKPLVHRLERLAPQAEVIFDLPSRLADGLAQRRFDVALIPSIEFFQDPGYRIVSDACIACRGPVFSVKLFCRVPAEKIRSLALDEGSRTSAALARILLKQRFGSEPALAPLPIGATLDDAKADAVLLIGDRAIHSPVGAFAEVWDLGDEWRRWAGLPFVFAIWTAWAGVDLDGLDVALGEARDLGVVDLEQIAAVEAAPLGLTVPQCVSYLRDHLHFYFGAPERRGLQLFYERAVEMKLAPPGRSLEVDECRAAAHGNADAGRVGYLGGAARVAERAGHQLSQSPVSNP
ncbi:MAG TPA: menaquinone biosynthesis protein [Pirellulales bacterium]|jgi:chorismate dehydratase|nr:menaquinone biosynthesis protein [Pirellulales bacterium]